MLFVGQSFSPRLVVRSKGWAANLEELKIQEQFTAIKAVSTQGTIAAPFKSASGCKCGTL